jgi:hypothetical protein
MMLKELISLNYISIYVFLSLDIISPGFIKNFSIFIEFLDFFYD